MLFDKKKDNVNERIIYKTKPNMILGCKKAIFGIIFLIIILMVSPMVIQFIGNMQVYLISYIKVSLTRFVAIAFFVIILINIIYIIWQLIGWYSKEYTLTDTRVMVKYGVISTKKNYMPYTTIQDLNTSQNIIAKIFNIGSISLFSAYDNSNIELKYISNPSEVEEIIFSRMSGSQTIQPNINRFNQQAQKLNNNEFYHEDDYYDEFEPITPITHENNSDRYVPNEFSQNNYNHHQYEYEPYNSGLNNNAQNNHFQDDFNIRENNYQKERFPHDDNYAQGEYNMNNSSKRQYQREEFPIREENYSYDNYHSRDNDYSHDNYYNQVRQEYSNKNNNNYQDNGAENQEYEQNLDDESKTSNSSHVIRRHFDKFKK